MNRHESVEVPDNENYEYSSEPKNPLESPLRDAMKTPASGVSTKNELVGELRNTSYSRSNSSMDSAARHKWEDELLNCERRASGGIIIVFVTLSMLNIAFDIRYVDFGK
ncbi:hypothetical protein KC333_g8004 [Hortaea werneckii]|nr:hypothetical protein KC333_g8004 [Hortaea werneckii]